MKRRSLVIGALSVAAEAAQAQWPPAQPRRIVVLSGAAPPVNLEKSSFGAFLQGMRELQAVEGRDFTVEWRFADGKYERLAEFAAEAVRLKVDVIVALNTRAALEAKRATSTIPIVFAAISDPLGSGLVDSLGRPGGNVTGVSEGLDATILKHFDLLRSTMARLSRLGVLINPDNPFYARLLDRLRGTAEGFSISVTTASARQPEEFDAAFDSLKTRRVQAVLVFDDSVFINQSRRLAAAAMRTGLPAIAGHREYANNGLLFSYGELIAEQFRRGAAHVVKVLRGAKPGELPVELPTRYYFVINRRTAKSLDFTLPAELLLRADEMID